MSSKSIVIGLIIIILIGGGIYYVYGMQPVIEGEPAVVPDTAVSDQVQGQDVTVGTGVEATPGSQVSILYEGRLQDGTVFDSSAAHDNVPLVFVLGAQGLIAGFQIGVNGMKEGGERMVLIPPSLAYGAEEIKDPAGKVLIPANSPLVFNLKLVKVAPAPAAGAKE